jgi:hypothetical protein
MPDFPHVYLGNFSAAPITHSVYLTCERCNVSWTGCWDNMECEYCGRDCLHGSDHPDNPEGISSRSIINVDTATLLSKPNQLPLK